jgi:NADH:ubiquinone reductase (non-electrogenic)
MLQLGATLQCVSPRNHMVFTPLLASTAVGTLEFRSVALPVRDIQPALTWPQNNYLAAEAKSIHPDKREVECESADGAKFWLSYDLLVIATGAAGSTFGIPGVRENAHFLRDVAHASKIRSKIIENLHLASTPGCSLTASIPRACSLAPCQSYACDGDTVLLFRGVPSIPRCQGTFS